MAQRIDILVIGDDAAQTLTCAGTSWSFRANVSAVPTVEEAWERAGHNAFDLIVMYAPRRVAMAMRHVEALQRRSPLSRFVFVAGPLCAGPWRREVDLLSGVTIVPWHRWSDWLQANAALLRRDLPSAWSLPRTAGVDELAEFWSRCDVPNSDGLVVIQSPDRDAAEAVGEMAAQGGFAYAWQPPQGETLIQGAHAVVVEANGWDEELANRLRSLRAAKTRTPVILLLNFPLPADVAAALAAGAASVIAKPFTLGEFLGQLDEAVAAARRAVASEAA